MSEISFSVEKSIRLESGQLLGGSSQCQHTMSNKQEQRVAHQENYHLWVCHGSWILELNEINGQRLHFRPLFIFDGQVEFLA